MAAKNRDFWDLGRGEIGSAQKKTGPGRGPQNMQPACRNSCPFGHRESLIFDENRWVFQSGSKFFQNSTKLANRTPDPGTRWPDRIPDPGTRKRCYRSPGGPWAQYINRLAWTCPLNGQIECGIDRYVGRIVYPDWYVESIDMWI